MLCVPGKRVYYAHTFLLPLLLVSFADVTNLDIGEEEKTEDRMSEETRCGERPL